MKLINICDNNNCDCTCNTCYDYNLNINGFAAIPSENYYFNFGCSNQKLINYIFCVIHKNQKLKVKVFK